MAEVFGLEVDGLPEGWQPVEAICIVKCMAFGDDEGGTAAARLAIKATEGLTTWEVLGILDGYADEARRQFNANLLEDDDAD